jgi:hypothetical protein
MVPLVETAEVSSTPPHWLQNLLPNGLTFPQTGQVGTSIVRQALQNLVSRGFGYEHFGQITPADSPEQIVIDTQHPLLTEVSLVQ